jgi:toxin-antitoxin system PIN domain toxin
MILVDANILLYSYDSSSEHHLKARGWLENILSEPQPVRLAWVTILAFLRISTNRKIFENPFSISEATSIVRKWLEHPVLDLLDPTERHWTILSKLLKDGQVYGPLVMDAHLAALAIEHGAKLYTTDKDFSRFDELEVTNPLSE